MHAYAITYNLRDEEDRDEVEAKLRRLCSSCEDALCVREEGTKNGWHWHLALRSRRLPTAFRRYFVRLMGLTSQDGIEKLYCIKKWDNGLEYLRYCAKGPTGAVAVKPISVYNSGYDLDQLHKAYFEKRLEMIEKRDAGRRAKKAKSSLRDQFVEFARNRLPQSRSDIISALEAFLHEEASRGVKLYVTPHKLSEWCEAVHCLLHPAVGTSSLAGKTADLWMRG